MKSTKSKKVVFLDRDGVINKKADKHCYITKEKDFVFNDGIFNVCLHLQNNGFEFIVITNQRGIARGFYTETDLEKIHNIMKRGFLEKGINLLDIFYCPHEEGVCNCRKPKPGMLEMSFEKYCFDKGGAILISDTMEDVSMGESFGIGKNIYVTSDKPEEALSFV
ncbi:MAG: D-glycero-D-manno-heptose 1,7-bisphosphate phosphatase [Patescibacteria group bacterium]|nr:D-glycero-D-manno-heptose 1,7-bisphosphate phosphatase [Patescibacteria group bacterium]